MSELGSKGFNFLQRCQEYQKKIERSALHLFSVSMSVKQIIPILLS
jgi:hypothetical protein